MIFLHMHGPKSAPRFYILAGCGNFAKLSSVKSIHVQVRYRESFIDVKSGRVPMWPAPGSEGATKQRATFDLMRRLTADFHDTVFGFGALTCIQMLKLFSTNGRPHVCRASREVQCLLFVGFQSAKKDAACRCDLAAFCAGRGTAAKQNQGSSQRTCGIEGH